MTAKPFALLNVAAHIESKNLRLNTFFTIDEHGNGYYIKEGRSYTPVEFAKAFPIVPVVKYVGENIDGKTNWLND